jgi:hypothetical protein
MVDRGKREIKSKRLLDQERPEQQILYMCKATTRSNRRQKNGTAEGKEQDGPVVLIFREGF